MQRHRLADAHVAKLRLLEVGIDPDLVERHDGHQRHAGLHALADLHAALRDVSGYRRQQMAARKVEIGAAQRGGRSLDVGMREQRRVVDHRVAARQLLPGRGQCALGGGQRLACVREFLGRDGAGGRQSLAAFVIGLGAFGHGAARFEFGLQTADIGIESAHLAHGAREVGLGLLERDAGVARVEVGEDLPGLDKSVVVGMDRDHRAGGLRRNLDDVAVGVGVLGALAPARDEVVVSDRPGRGEREADAESGQPLLAARIGGLGFDRMFVAHFSFPLQSHERQPIARPALRSGSRRRARVRG